jgi:hypothetical protein
MLKIVQGQKHFLRVFYKYATYKNIIEKMVYRTQNREDSVSIEKGKGIPFLFKNYNFAI